MIEIKRHKYQVSVMYAFTKSVSECMQDVDTCRHDDSDESERSGLSIMSHQSTGSWHESS